MDKLLGNKWIMRLLSLLLAVMLYESVNGDVYQKKEFSLNGPITEIVSNVPVNTYYDKENLIISGIPKQVDVTLKGKSNVITPIKVQKDFEVYMDLSAIKIGTSIIPIKYKNIPKEVSVTIQPAMVTVTVHEKVTHPFPVTVEFLHKELPSGYTIGSTVITPSTVMITGAKEMVKKIKTVKIFVDINGKSTIQQEQPVKAYDKTGNVLDVDISPSIVNVTIPIQSPSKTVPFKINRVGTIDSDLSIVNIEAFPSKVTIFGSEEILTPIQFLDGITVDLNDIKESTKLVFDVPVPKGVDSIDPKKIEVYVEVQKTEKKLLTGIPIHVVGLNSAYTIQFLTPLNKTVNASIFGATEVLNNLSEKNLDAYVSVGDMEAGEYTVPIEVSGPENVRWELSESTARIQITKK